MLAFEPMDFGPLFGAARGRGTIGGVLAANASGPRRIKAGAARDHVLGIKAVSGRGEAFKSGGRVVKNVTGYDLSKGLAGSWGTLAVVTEVTFKVLPRPETRRDAGRSPGSTTRAPLPRSARRWARRGTFRARRICPKRSWPQRRTPPFATGGRAATLIRLEGFAPSVAYRAEKLKALFAPLGEVSVLEADAAERLWRAVRDAAIFDATMHPVWRVSVAPTAGPAVIAALEEPHAIRHFYDWSGGLIWIEATDEAQDGLARDIRAAVAAAGGGHATLMRGSPALRSAVPPFEPQPEPLAALSRRLKEQFDPRGILNPGRMVARRSDADQLLPRAARRPEHRGSGFDPPPLRALRLLPRHLPDLPGARQRARFAARKNLPDQGHAGERQAGVEARSRLHIDRCLSCLSCVTTCPSGVDYMHLVDQARVRIEKTYRRPLPTACCAALLARMLPYRGRFRAALIAGAARRARSAPLLEQFGPAGARLEPRCCALAPRRAPARSAIAGRA